MTITPPSPGTESCVSTCGRGASFQLTRPQNKCCSAKSASAVEKKTLSAYSDDFVGQDEEILILQLLQGIVEHILADWLDENKHTHTHNVRELDSGWVEQGKRTLPK